MFNKNSRVLLTGGTGSFGKAFLDYVFKNNLDFGQLCIFSRDELKQWELQQKYPKKDYPNLRFFLGDIRDKDRLERALYGVDIVIHAAALKQVPAAEYNPIEFIKTNVLGAENIIECCLNSDVKKVVALSTDKAAAPINLYGATKLCSDKLFIAANNITGQKNISFSVVRYGNVMGSRGSVIPFFIKESKNKVLPITDENMTRFNIILEDGVKMVLWTLRNMKGGEIFVPKIPSYRIKDLAKAICENCSIKIVGIRPGEKIHEEMIAKSDSFSTIDLGNYYAILPSDRSIHKKYISDNIDFKEVSKNFSYNSGENEIFLTVEEIRDLIKTKLKGEN